MKSFKPIIENFHFFIVFIIFVSSCLLQNIKHYSLCNWYRLLYLDFISIPFTLSRSHIHSSHFMLPNYTQHEQMNRQLVCNVRLILCISSDYDWGSHCIFFIFIITRNITIFLGNTTFHIKCARSLRQNNREKKMKIDRETITSIMYHWLE